MEVPMVVAHSGVETEFDKAVVVEGVRQHTQFRHVLKHGVCLPFDELCEEVRQPNRHPRRKIDPTPQSRLSRDPRATGAFVRESSEMLILNAFADHILSLLDGHTF